MVRISLTTNSCRSVNELILKKQKLGLKRWSPYNGKQDPPQRLQTNPNFAVKEKTNL